MEILAADLLVPAVVAVVMVPAVQYLLNRRSAQVQGAFAARSAFYERLLTNLTRYAEYVKWLPPNQRSPQPDDDVDAVVITQEIELSMRLHAARSSVYA